MCLKENVHTFYESVDVFWMRSIIGFLLHTFNKIIDILANQWHIQYSEIPLKAASLILPLHYVVTVSLSCPESLLIFWHCC